MDQSHINYNTSAVQVGNLVQDGTEFILITRSKQGEGFTTYSSGDSEVTQQLFRQAQTQVSDLQTA